MPLNKYAALPTAGMAVFYLASYCKDLAVIDFSTVGHGLYNYGHLNRLEPLPENADRRIFSTHLSEVDIALGDTKRLYRATEEAVNSGYKNIFLMLSSIASKLGLDLEAYANELSNAFNVNIFTVNVDLNDDYYKGRDAFLMSMSCFCKDRNPIKSNTYNLLGGTPSYVSKQNHKVMADLIKEQLNIDCNFDNLNAGSVCDWDKVAKAKLNIVTTKRDVKIAQFLESAYVILYIYACGWGMDLQDYFLAKVASFFGMKYIAVPNSTHEFVMLQLKNIILINQPKIVCYGDVDKIASIKVLFDKLNIQSEYYCSYKTDDCKQLLPDKFIMKCASTDSVVVSYDRICKQFKTSVVIDYMDLDYYLLIPLSKADFNINGAYRFAENLSKLFFIV